MLRYKCKDCGGNQYTSNPNAAGKPCIYCKSTKVNLDGFGDSPSIKTETEETKMKRLTLAISEAVEQELERACEKFGKQHNSPHEAYGVIAEELEEFTDELSAITKDFDGFKHFMMANNRNDIAVAARKLHLSAIRACAELAQVAAMARKCEYGYSIDDRTRTNEKEVAE